MRCTPWPMRGYHRRALLALALAGCTTEHPPTERTDTTQDRSSVTTRSSAAIFTDSALQPAVRTFDSAAWTPLWARGGRQEEALLGTVRQVVTLHDLVLAADEGTLEIHAFARNTGEHRFTVGGTGGGPGEFRQLTDVLVLPDSQFAVYDRTAQRLTKYSRRGTLLGTAPVPPALSGAESLCATSTPWLAGVTRESSAWVTLAAYPRRAPAASRETSTAKAIPMPLAGTNGRRAAQPQQGASLYGYSARFAQGSIGTTCVMVTRFAIGIAQLTMPDAAGRGHTLVLSPYVERLSMPQFTTATERVGRELSSTTVMNEGHTAMVHASTWHDTVAVTFLGAPSPNKPLLDLYSTRGAYLTSWAFPAPVEFGAYADGMLFTIGGSGVAPQLVAWQRRSTSAPSGTN